MLKYISAVLLRAPLRPLVLAVGLLVAAVSFSLLTAAVQTSQAQVTGTLNKNFRAAYDILVRPAGSQTAVERSSGLVRPNFQSGIYGGITEAQWKQILAIPGVDVAAPLANAGIISSFAILPLPLPEAEQADKAGRAYRIAQTWTAVRGVSRYPGNRDYVYATSDPGGCDRLEGNGDPVVSPDPDSAFEVSGPKRSTLFCYANTVSGTGKSCWQLQPNYFGPQVCDVQDYIELDFPLAVAGVDPVQESKLLGLDHTIVTGRGLTESDTYTTDDHGATVPVIASTRTYADIELQLDVGRVAVPAGKDFAALLTTAGKGSAQTGSGGYQALRALPVSQVRTVRLSADQLYQQALESYTTGLGNSGVIGEYWTPGPVIYSRKGDNGVLAPRTVTQDPSVFQNGSGIYGWAYVNPASADVQYRQLQIHVAIPQRPDWGGSGRLNVVGRFDPAKLPHFSPLSQVPLETYNPPVAVGADPASRRVLGDQPYRPTLNIGGYLLQPPQLLTTLAGVQGVTSSRFYRDGSDKAFISVIRVRVAGVSGTDPLSIGRVKTVAAEIHQRTGLDVDITAGSSPAPQDVQLVKSPFGAPPLLLQENWVAKGVAVAIRAAIDNKSLVLLVMILFVTAVFLLNAGIASVRARRQELGTLLCLGWRPRQLFGAVLGELIVVGVIAGVVGTGLAFALSAALALDQPAWRLALVAPVSVGLATLAGLVPAVAAARGAPLDVVAPPVRAPRRPPRRDSLTRLAVGNLRGSRARTLLAALALYIGVAAFAGILAITLAFRGTVVGTLLGDVVAVQVRGSDYVIVALILLLSAVALTDVLVLGMRERAVELVTLRVLGWSDTQLARLVLTEGLTIGALGAILGAGTGAGIGLALSATGSAAATAAGIAAAAGLTAAALASLGPALAVSRLPIGVASAEA